MAPSLALRNRLSRKDIWVEDEFEDGALIGYGVGFPENGSREPLGYHDGHRF